MALTLIENFRAVFYTPFYAAFARKAYEAGGVEVQRVMSTTLAETAQALRSGRADVAWGGPIRLLFPRAHGLYILLHDAAMHGT